MSQAGSLEALLLGSAGFQELYDFLVAGLPGMRTCRPAFLVPRVYLGTLFDQ